MRSSSQVRIVLSTLAVAGFAACGGDTPGITDPPVGGNDSASVTAATNTLLTQMNDAMDAMNQALNAGGVMTGFRLATALAVAGTSSDVGAVEKAPPPDAAKCSFDSVTVRHSCPNHTLANGVVISTWFQFLDAANVPHQHPDTATTVAIRRFVERSGVVTSQHTSQAGTVPAKDTIRISDTLTLSGLKGPPAGRKLNGKGAMAVVIVPQGQPVATVSATTTTENFAFLPPPPPPELPTVRYPISGKVTALVTSRRSDQPPQAGSTTTQVTTFDGTKIATLVISQANGTVLRTCTWDMTSTAPPACTVP